MDFRYKKAKQKTLLIGNYLFVLKNEPFKTNQIWAAGLSSRLRAIAVIVPDGLDFFPLTGLWRDGEKDRLSSLCLAS